MTTYFPFTPSPLAPPIFQPTLDGNVYTIYVKWSLFGKRYYLECYDATYTLVFNVARTETQPGLTIQSLTWDSSALLVTVTTAAPHLYKVGGTINLTIQEANPDTYNGQQTMLVTSPTTLTYAQPTDPGGVLSSGQLSYLISMCQGYFNSTLIYRSGQFEVSP